MKFLKVVADKLSSKNQDQLKEAIIDWVSKDKKDKLENLWKTHRELFSNISGKEKYYRGIVLEEEAYNEFMGGKQKKSSTLFESWTSSRSSATYFMRLRLDEGWGQYGVLLYKRPKDIILNVSDIAQQLGLKGLHGVYGREKEIIALSEFHDKQSVIEIIDGDFQKIKFKLEASVSEESLLDPSVEMVKASEGQFLSKVEAALSKKYPYIHYSRLEKTPTIKANPTYKDPRAIYFFRKDAAPWGGGWDTNANVKYAHEANIDTSKQLNLGEIQRSKAEIFLKKSGVDITNMDQMLDLCKNCGEDGSLGGSDFDSKNYQNPESFQKLWDRDWRWAWYAFLRLHINDPHKLTKFFKGLGFNSLFDEDGILYSGEEKVTIVLSPEIIEWGNVIEYQAEKDFDKIHSAAQEADGIVTQRVHPKSGQKRWALVSRKKVGGKRKVLRWFKGKPSKKTVSKEERRVQFFKNKG